jgi:hypothetical protein
MKATTKSVGRKSLRPKNVNRVPSRINAAANTSASAPLSEGNQKNKSQKLQQKKKTIWKTVIRGIPQLKRRKNKMKIVPTNSVVIIKCLHFCLVCVAKRVESWMRSCDESSRIQRQGSKIAAAQGPRIFPKNCTKINRAPKK